MTSRILMPHDFERLTYEIARSRCSAYGATGKPCCLQYDVGRDHPCAVCQVTHPAATCQHCWGQLSEPKNPKSLRVWELHLIAQFPELVPRLGIWEAIAACKEKQGWVTELNAQVTTTGGIRVLALKIQVETPAPGIEGWRARYGVRTLYYGAKELEHEDHGALTTALGEISSSLVTYPGPIRTLADIPAPGYDR